MILFWLMFVISCSFTKKSWSAAAYSYAVSDVEAFLLLRSSLGDGCLSVRFDMGAGVPSALEGKTHLSEIHEVLFDRGFGAELGRVCLATHQFGHLFSKK